MIAWLKNLNDASEDVAKLLFPDWVLLPII
jgi:hypothetical protein